MCSMEARYQLADALADAGRQLHDNMEKLVGACARPDVDVEALMGLQVVREKRGRWLAEQVYLECMMFSRNHRDILAIADNEIWRASSSLLEMHLRRPNAHRSYVEAVICEFEAAFHTRLAELLMLTPPLRNTRH